jgi:hypothetical protein
MNYHELIVVVYKKIVNKINIMWEKIGKFTILIKHVYSIYKVGF